VDNVVRHLLLCETNTPKTIYHLQMTIRQGLLLVGTLAIAGGVVLRGMEERTTIAPGPETESRFIQTYDPTAVTNSFRFPCTPGDGFALVSRTQSDSAGSLLIGHQRAVEHHLSVMPRFCGNADRVSKLMATLQESVGNALRAVGCEVSAGWLMTEPVVHIIYHCGTVTTGVVKAQMSTAAPGDRVHLALSFHVDERWL
jgi:hypothetical protein